jgi:hypothetical protein
MLVRLVSVTFQSGQAVVMCHPVGRGTGRVARQKPITLKLPREDGVKVCERMSAGEINGEITA